MGEHLLIIDDDFWTAQRFRYNRSATTDPDANDDATLGVSDGYAVGSLWFNTSTGTIWICRVATIGAAVWDRADISDHDELTGVSVDDHHSQVHDHAGGGDQGGILAAADIPIVDAGGHYATDEVESALQEAGADLDALELLSNILNGVTVEDTAQTVTEAGGTVSLNFEANGGGDVQILFNAGLVTLDCTPTAAVVALTAGTDADPQLNYVYVTESGGTVTLAKSTAGWPSAEDFAPIATVLVPTAALVATDGPYKHHAWTDHLQNSVNTGHVSHINKKLRAQEATWVSGCAANALVIADPDAHFLVDAGVVFQLHEHAFPAIDTSSVTMPGGMFLQNDPTTPNKHAHTFDDITQDAAGGAINNKWFPLVVWGVVSENGDDCKIFINLPTGTYVNEALALADSANYAVYTVPVDYRGTGFLIARYVVQGKDSGAWVEATGSPFDLRGLAPAISPGAGTAITDHGGLAGLGDDDHPQYTQDAEVDTIVATHTSDVDAHHARSHDHSDGDDGDELVPGLLTLPEAGEIPPAGALFGEIFNSFEGGTIRVSLGPSTWDIYYPGPHHDRSHDHSAAGDGVDLNPTSIDGFELQGDITVDAGSTYNLAEESARLVAVYAEIIDIGTGAGHLRLPENEQSGQGRLAYNPTDDTLWVGNGATADDFFPTASDTPDAITFGQSGAAGTSKRNARADHAHETPAAPAASGPGGKLHLYSNVV